MVKLCSCRKLNYKLENLYLMIKKVGVYLIALLILCCKENQPKISQLAPKPNVIIVFADDQGYGDLGYHGNPIMKTPNLDTFAESSLELTNFHVGTTCAPSRAGLLTGRNANRNNAWHTIAGCSILSENEETIAEVFKKNQYETAMFGKWHLGDNYPYRPIDRGFQHALYHGGGGIGQTPDYWKNDYFDDTYFRNGKPEKFTGYCTDVWFDQAMDYLNKRNEQEPFFMYLALNAAHSPFNVPGVYAEMYEDAPLSKEQKRFYGMVSNIDNNFGRLVDYLKKNKLFDNTILIFATDNGTAKGISFSKNENKELGYNAGLRGIKGSHYDGGHRVPFIMSWPKGGILQRTDINELVAHVDVLPTLAELAGLSWEAKNPVDGTSVAKILKGDEQGLDRMLVIDTQRNQWPAKGRNSCVMSTRWRLIDGKELYNTINDPGQKNDLSKEYPEIVTKMQTFYDQWWESTAKDMAYAEIPVGYQEHNPVKLTIHDMHTQDNIPWNQVLIREGELKPVGFYSINVVQDGTYKFRLSRYPPESNLAINGVATEIPTTPYADGAPESKSIRAKMAVVEIGDTRIQVVVKDDQPYALLEGKLRKGNYKLKSKFTSDDGKEIPAYYTVIEYAKPN